MDGSSITPLCNELLLPHHLFFLLLCTFTYRGLQITFEKFFLSFTCVFRSHIFREVLVEMFALG